MFYLISLALINLIGIIRLLYDYRRMEINEAEAMMRRTGIRWLSTTTKSIEEIATTILQEIHPERLDY